MNETSVRTWQERFRTGGFSSRDRAVQCEAGWYNWFCRDDVLAGCLEKISNVALEITDPFILDNYYVWSKNSCPLGGPLHDDVRFESSVGERDRKHFLAALDSYYELIEWTLCTKRYGYNTSEFRCGSVREMTAYTNAMAPELTQRIQPRFVLERTAVGEHVRQYEGKVTYSTRWEGDHLFTCQSFRNWKYQTVTVSDSSENVPQGFPVERAEQHGMLYVFPGEAPALDRADYAARRAQRRKEQMR